MRKRISEKMVHEIRLNQNTVNLKNNAEFTLRLITRRCFWKSRHELIGLTLIPHSKGALNDLYNDFSKFGEP